MRGFKPMTTHIALLRGINLGAKNRVAMNELAASFTEAGAENVRTYIQSGNVLFRAPLRKADTIARAVSQRWSVPVLLRTREELSAVIDSNPFAAEGRAENTLHVLFLADPINAEALSALAPARFAPDEMAAAGKEIFFYLPNGVAQSKVLRQPLDSIIKRVCTMRNWRTTTKLLELASADR
jgi:uncharacterized protein (DUF1697 family)